MGDYGIYIFEFVCAYSGVLALFIQLNTSGVLLTGDSVT